MTKQGFHERHRIVRSAIKKDLLYFGIPALVIFTAGLIFSAMDGWTGLFRTLWDLIRDPRAMLELPPQSVIGMALILTGFTIAFVSAGTLRWSYASTLVIRKEHRLVTHGIYRFTRHPIYLGVIMITLGVPLYVSSIRGLLTMSALIPVFLIRIGLEEALLTEEFGDRYRAYKKATKTLVPFIF